METVILIHAAVVNHRTLSILGRRLGKLGFEVRNLPYPNRRLDVEGCAEFLLADFQKIAEGAPRVHLVGHSMGGLVARRLLYLHQPENFGRLVTLGTPHQGSPLADMLHKWPFYQKLFGPAGQELRTIPPIDQLAPWPPPYEIGLIAGSIPIGPGTLFMTWASDGTVAHISSQPPGGTGYAKVPATHTTIPFLKKTARLIARFLKTGRFEPDRNQNSQP